MSMKTPEQVQERKKNVRWGTSTIVLFLIVAAWYVVSFGLCLGVETGASIDDRVAHIMPSSVSLCISWVLMVNTLKDGISMRGFKFALLAWAVAAVTPIALSYVF